jgi:hypothetical protein
MSSLGRPTLRGELAEDSLDVPSYIPAFMSTAIIYDWLSAALSLYPVDIVLDQATEVLFKRVVVTGT